MRADFYDRPLADPRLGALFAENVVNVIPLGPEELEAAATIPARQLDVVVEPRLLGRLIVDVAGQPNALPLFQYALTELFDERSGPVLDLATYERIGGVRKAVARRAESIYTHLDGPEQQAVRQLFLRIATISGEAVGRRRVPASELAALDVDVVALQGAIDAFTRYRLLALDRDPDDGLADGRGGPRGPARGVASPAGLDRGEPRRPHHPRAARRGSQRVGRRGTRPWLPPEWSATGQLRVVGLGHASCS